MSNESFKPADPLDIDSATCKVIENHDTVVSINDWLLYVHEARELRDWLNKVIP
jgi:hypothetical protein